MEVDLPFCRFPFTQCDVNAIASSHAFTLREIGFFHIQRSKASRQRDRADVRFADSSSRGSDQRQHERRRNLYVLLRSPRRFPDRNAGSARHESLSKLREFYALSALRDLDRAHSNSVVFRQLHSLLTSLRPADHSPHVSIPSRANLTLRQRVKLKYAVVYSSLRPTRARSPVQLRRLINA